MDDEKKEECVMAFVLLKKMSYVYNLWPLLSAVLGAALFSLTALLVFWIAGANEFQITQKLILISFEIVGLVCGWFFGVKYFARNKLKELAGKIRSLINKEEAIKSYILEKIDSEGQKDPIYAKTLRTLVLRGF